MGSLALTHMIPLDELTPGAVGFIRNSVIDNVVAFAARELNLEPGNLVVRDVRPFTDLSMYAAGTTASTVDEWLYDATTTTASAFTSVTGPATMGDNRYVALFGVRDLRLGIGLHTTAMTLMDGTGSLLFGSATASGAAIKPGQVISLIKIAVGGSDKAIWDTTCFEGYQNLTGFSPSAVIIPQNATFNISYYFKSTVAGVRANIQLVGVTVEPRGKVLSP